MTENPPVKLTRKDFASDQDVRWCPGCGDYAILAAIQRTLPDLGTPPEKTVFISGIGCAARFPYYMSTYGFHTIHGRAPAFATGLKLANPDLDVWVITGDGDALSIGGNHLLHALRRNVNLQIVLFNNRIYGLTKGQYSPTSLVGKVTPSTPLGSVDLPVAPLSFALGAGATFAARAYDVSKRLPDVLKRAHGHKGSALVEVMQNCNVFNDGAWDVIRDKKTGSMNQLWLEHGKPMTFGPGDSYGIRLVAGGLGLEIVELSQEGVTESDLLVHDETNRAQAFLLAQLQVPVPMGVLFAVDAPNYDADVVAQKQQQVERDGVGEMHELLRRGHTWTVE